MGETYNPSLTPCHVSSVYFQSKCTFFPLLPSLRVSLANENQAVFFFSSPAINNGQITKCRFWSWHVYCWWWCINWWPTASFSLSWKGPAGRIGEEKNFWFWLVVKQLDKHDMTWMSECIMQPRAPRWDWRIYRHGQNTCSWKSGADSQHLVFLWCCEILE